MARVLKRIAGETLLVLAGAAFIVGLVATVGIPAGRENPANVQAAREPSHVGPPSGPPALAPRPWGP